MPRNNKTLPDQEQLKQMFLYDETTGTLVWRKRDFNSIRANGWNTRYANQIAGVKNSVGYICVSIGKSRYLAHRIIWKLLHGTEPLIVDHIDGNRANNKANNLRGATESLSAFNKRLKSRALPRGVSQNKNGYMARICNRYIGTYKTPEDAHLAYCNAAHITFTPPTQAFPNQ